MRRVRSRRVVVEKVKRGSQPRLGDESTRWVHRCLNTGVEGLDAAEPHTPDRRVLVSGVRAAGSAQEKRDLTERLRQDANTNRHSGFCRLPS